MLHAFLGFKPRSMRCYNYWSTGLGMGQMIAWSGDACLAVVSTYLTEKEMQGGY